MRNTKILIAGLAALFAASTIEVAAFVKPSGNSGIESSVELAAGKKKAKKKKVVKKKGVKKKAAKKAKATKVAAFKSCGTFMYNKGGKCVDARAKK